MFMYNIFMYTYLYSLLFAAKKPDGVFRESSCRLPLETSIACEPWSRQTVFVLFPQQACESLKLEWAWLQRTISWVMHIGIHTQKDLYDSIYRSLSTYCTGALPVPEVLLRARINAISKAISVAEAGPSNSRISHLATWDTWSRAV